MNKNKYYFSVIVFGLFQTISVAFAGDFSILQSKNQSTTFENVNIKIIYVSKTVNCKSTIDWGDGSNEAYYFSNQYTPEKKDFDLAHRYKSAGDFRVRIKGDARDLGCIGNEEIIASVRDSNSIAQNTTTPPPVSVAATQTAPARVAAIANVDVPTKAAAGSKVTNQPTQLTTNPLDQLKKTSGNEVWISFNPSITIQQRQFCRIVENFRTENALALQSKNQIKVNETYRNLTQSLNSLLPDGKFQGWVMRTVAVDQASDGSAEVLLEMPCNIYVGSNACDANPKNYYGTAPEGSRMYTELAKMTVGDFALTSGQFVYTDDKAFDKNRSVASFRYMRTAAHCKAKEVAADTEFFGIKLDVISTIK